jgi:3-phosphoshikimate 1-carboxyvinyltransferase
VKDHLRITRQSTIHGITHQLPSSKSISNRALVCDALGGNQSTLLNLSAARDTRLMRALIHSPEEVIDVMDAGTTMRFLTAYFSITRQPKVMTGSLRMKERPVSLLVDALRTLGVRMDYLEKEGFPPIAIRGFDSQKTNALEIAGNVSSQYISALMMVAPTLPQGLELRLTGSVGSVPYIQMTVELMKSFGVFVAFQGNRIHIPSQSYRPATLTIEADWSAASYWYGFTALADEAKIHLPHVTQQSWQGDVAIVEIMKLLGVDTRFEKTGAHLIKQSHHSHLDWDFTHCPDLAQTVLPVCAVKGIGGSFTGLESLRIKETDRIAALQKELIKVGCRLTEDQKGRWLLSPGNIPDKPITIHTYHDHRMAMGFAPWACLTELTIEQSQVVDKSYPGFWEDMKTVGFDLVS